MTRAKTVGLDQYSHERLDIIQTCAFREIPQRVDSGLANAHLQIDLC